MKDLLIAGIIGAVVAVIIVLGLMYAIDATGFSIIKSI